MFNKLKAAVANSILVTYPDPTKPFTYYPDSSQKYACGRLLCQTQDGVELTVGTYSKKWTDAKLVYPVGEQELAHATRACGILTTLCEVVTY